MKLILSILLGTLTALPIAINFNTNPANALVTENALTQNLSALEIGNDNASEDSQTQSMRYVERGLAAHKDGDKETALAYYQKALELDQYNPAAYMGAAMAIGHSEDGISCMKAAAALFQAQNNQEGYNLAQEWLSIGNQG